MHRRELPKAICALVMIAGLILQPLAVLAQSANNNNNNQGGQQGP